MELQMKRIYDEVSKDDGTRVLVDRLWPRGVKKDDAAVDLWAKDLAPSPEARKFFNHDPAKFEEFRGRYEQELDERSEAQELIDQLKGEKKVTLLYAAKDKENNHAVILLEYLQKHIAGASFAEPRSL